jgi:hypothetical protein
VGSKSRHAVSPVAIAAAVAALAAGAGILAQALASGLVAGPGARQIAFMAGAVICTIGVCLFVRGLRLRRRARTIRIASLLPRLSRARIGDARLSLGIGDELAEGFLRDDFTTADDLSDGIPSAPSEIRAATRALLVSLEEELRREGRRPRRTGRPACRRARLRVVGRSEPKRRRVRARPVSIPS